MTGPRAPIRLAVVNDYEIVVVGIAAMLEPFRDRVEVVELDSGLSVMSTVDVILYDTFGQPQGSGLAVEKLMQPGARLVIYSWKLDPELLRTSLKSGVAGYLSKAAPAKDIIGCLERVVDGETVVPPDFEVADPDVTGAWPGREAGLTARESEIIALITQGESNQEIADRSYLSINSVKTYIRTAYRKMGVTRRSQAVLWGVEHGFEPDVLRRVRDRG